MAQIACAAAAEAIARRCPRPARPRLPHDFVDADDWTTSRSTCPLMMTTKTMRWWVGHLLHLPGLRGISWWTRCGGASSAAAGAACAWPRGRRASHRGPSGAQLCGRWRSGSPPAALEQREQGGSKEERWKRIGHQQRKWPNPRNSDETNYKTTKRVRNFRQNDDKRGKKTHRTGWRKVGIVHWREPARRERKESNQRRRRGEREVRLRTK